VPWLPPATPRVLHTTKAAQRSLAETLARELGPQGIHVAYVLIDAVIDLKVDAQAVAVRSRSLFITPATICRGSLARRPQRAACVVLHVELRPSDRGYLRHSVESGNHFRFTPSVAAVAAKSRRAAGCGLSTIPFDCAQARLRLRRCFAQGTLSPKGSSLAASTPPGMSVVSQHGAGENVKKPAPRHARTRSRRLQARPAPQDSALAAARGWRYAAQPLTGTRRAALLGALCSGARPSTRYALDVFPRPPNVCSRTAGVACRNISKC